MTNLPQGGDEPGRKRPGHGPGEQSDPDRHPTQPVPFVDAPRQPYGGPVQPPSQPYGQHGRPQPQAHPGGPYGHPVPPSQPYGEYGHAPQYGQSAQGQPQYAPPPYAQPQYGAAPGPYGQPTATSRVGLIAAVTAGIVALIAVGVVLALTMGSTVLDRNAVQQDVAAQFEEREGVAIDLECAEEMTVTSGANYECTGITADGEDVTLQIAITDEEAAAYTWTEP